MLLDQLEHPLWSLRLTSPDVSTNASQCIDPYRKTYRARRFFLWSCFVLSSGPIMKNGGTLTFVVGLKLLPRSLRVVALGKPEDRVELTDREAKDAKFV